MLNAKTYKEGTVLLWKKTKLQKKEIITMESIISMDGEED
jgi:hypothetical protein